MLARRTLPSGVNRGLGAQTVCRAEATENSDSSKHLRCDRAALHFRSLALCIFWLTLFCELCLQRAQRIGARA
jgi:hypothetical protein